MDPTPSPLARVGQVFWVVLRFVTGAVQRYLIPEPANTGNDDTHTGQEATISVATETQEWTEGDKDERENIEGAEKKMKEDRESVADTHDSWTDEPTTKREKKAKGPQFTNEKNESESERHGSISNCGVQTHEDITYGADTEMGGERQTEKETGSQKYREIGKPFNTRDTSTERGNKILREEESGQNLEGERTITDVLGKETEGGSRQRTDGDKKDQSECRVRKLETNWDEGNKVTIQEEREGEGENSESKIEIETGEKIENSEGGWIDVPTKEQQMQKSERGQNGNSALGRQIGASDKDGVITDLENTELSQTEVTVGNKGNESIEYSEEDEIKSIEIRKIETENREFKEIAKECGVVTGEKENKNLMAKREEEENKTMREEKKEHERHIITELLVGQGNRGDYLNPTVEMEGGPVSEEEDAKEETEVEEEKGLILMEATGGKNTKEIREHGYSGEMEASMWGTEEIVEEIEVRPELLVPISVERNDKDVLNEETHSDVEDDYFTKETETDKDADEKDLGILGTDDDERITDIGRNENSFIEMTVTNKEQEQRQSEGCSEDKDMESVEMRKTETEEKDLNTSLGETERENSTAEIEKEETIRQEGESRGEMEEEEEEKDIKTHIEEVCHKGALEQLAFEEGDELTKEGWKENIQREKRRSSNGVQEKVILDGDRQERKDDEGISVEEERQFSEFMTEGKQRHRGDDLNPTVELEGGPLNEEEDAKEETEVEEEERLILMEATGGKNTKEVGEHDYSGQMEASMWGTEEIVEEIEVRPELLVPISVERNDKDVLNEETQSDVEDDYFTKETETDKDADEKDLGILGTDNDERITDIRRNENSFIEMTVTNKEQEQRQSEGCSEDKDMESVEMRKTETEEKDLNTSLGETEREKSTAEIEKEETIRQEGESRGEMEEEEEEKDIKTHIEEVCHKGALEQLAFEEGDELTKEGWKENIQREKRRSSNGVQEKVILDGDRQERKDDEGIGVDEERQFSEFMTEGKQRHRGDDLNPTVELEGGPLNEEEDAKEKTEVEEEERLILMEATGGKNTKEVGEHDYSGQMEASMWGTEEIVEEIEVRPELLVPISVERNDKDVLNEETHSDVEDDYFTKETETDKDADEKDLGILGTDNDERITDIRRNENSFIEMTVTNKEQEQRQSEGCSEDKDMESVEMRKTETEEKDVNTSLGETEREKSTAEIEKEETIRQEGESRGEMEEEEEEKDIKTHIEEVCHKGALEQLAFEEGDELTKEGWKENIQREKRRSSNGVQEKVILDGDRQERKDDEGIGVDEERQFPEFMTEGKQRHRGDDLNPTVELEGGPLNEEEDAKEKTEVEEEERLILMEATGGKNTKEVGEHDYSGQMEASMWGTEEIVAEIEVRPELLVPISVERNDKDVLNEETHSDVEDDYFTKETETDKDADEKDLGILGTDDGERITDIGRNENSFIEMTVTNKEQEQRQSEGCSEDKDMESVEIWKTETEEKDLNTSLGETEKEKSTAEIEKEETIWQEGESRGEMEEEEEEKDIKTHIEEVCHKGALEQLAFEEGGELSKEGWKEDIEREKRSSNGVQENVILDGDRQERKDDEGISVEEERQFSEFMTEGKQGNRGDDLNPTVEMEGGPVSEEEDAKEETEVEEEERLILMEATGGKNTKEVGEHDYSGQMEASMWGTEEIVEEIEVRPELLVPISVERNDKDVLNEETHSDVEDDYFTKETETDKDADEKDLGILGTDDDERITDIGRNENSFIEMTVTNKEQEQRQSEGCSEDKDMESVEMRKTETEEKDLNTSLGETERENSTAEIEKEETIRQEGESRGEMEEEEEEKDIKTHIEEVCHKGALEQLAFEEGGELSKEGWKEDIEREKRRSSNGVQENVILDGDRQERKDDEGISVEEERQFSEFITEGKQRHRGDDLNPTVELEGGPLNEEEDAKEETEVVEEERLILMEATGGKNTKEVGEHDYSGQMEASMWGTEEIVEEIEVRPELLVPISVERNDKDVLNEETHSDVEDDYFTKETETDKDADEKDLGILGTDDDERITDIGRNENSFIEMTVTNKEQEQRQSEGCSEDKDMESVEMRKTETEEKDLNTSLGETEREKSTAEIEKEETIRQEGESRGEMEEEEEEKDIKTHIEEVCHKGALEQLAFEEGDELTKEGWKENIQREKRRSSNGVQEKVILDGDRQERKDDEGIGVDEERQFSEFMTEGKQRHRGHDLNPTLELEGGPLNEEEDAKEETEVEEEERLILMEATGGKNTKEVGEHDYSGQMEASMWGTEEIVEEIEVRPELLVPMSVERNDKDVLNEETHSDVEDDYFTKETETDKDADEKDLGILGTDDDERITDIRRNENSLIEMTVTDKEQEQRQSEGCSEDKDLESVEIWKTETEEKDLNTSSGETEREKSTAEIEKEETIRQEGESRGEMEEEEEEKNIKTHVEEVCHKGALEQLAFEEGDELTQEGWKENIQREKRRSSNGVQEKVILDGDRQERKDDEGISVEEERQFSEFKTEGKQGNRGDDLNPTVEMEGGPVKEEEDAKEEPERNNEEVKPTLIHWENIDGRETEERPTTRLDNKEPEGLNVQEENLEMKEIADKWIELHPPSLDFTAQKSRISLKNAHSRPPRNPRALLHKQSLLPTPSKLQQSRQLKIVPMAVKQGGPIMKGFKLPVGEFPSLKKTDRGVREKEEGFTAEAPDATKMLTSERQEVVGDKAVAMGLIGVKLPGFSAEFPGLRKTERGVKMREQAPEKNTTSHDNSSERHDSTGTDSIKGITVPAFKLTGFSSGFPALRKTNRGVKIREGEDTQSYTQNSEEEASTTVVDGQELLPKAKSKWTPPGKPGIGIGNPSMMSELKNKLRKTE